MCMKKMTFTEKDLEQIKDKCVAELNALGYEVLPIEAVKFSGRLRKYYATAQLTKNSLKSSHNGIIDSPVIEIVVRKDLSFLDVRWKENLKCLIMHECIHAIKSRNFPNEIMTMHGPDYDKIKTNIENIYGYAGIDDNLHHGFPAALGC